MKVLEQKLPLREDSSFIAKTFRTPYFETPWHQHEEIELALCVEGRGTCFIGNYIGEFVPGEVYLFGSQLPHWFKKKESDMVCAVVVIHFNVSRFGEHFFSLPEMGKIKWLLEESRKGMKLTGSLSSQIAANLQEIEIQSGFMQLNNLLQSLHLISESKEYDLLSEFYVPISSLDNQEKIASIFEYTMENFQRTITLEEVAELTNQSVSNFCRYFKLNTKKSYITFVNEVRVSHACKLLKKTQLDIAKICYASGFSSWTNFSKQFKKVKNLTPSEYRKISAM